MTKEEYLHFVNNQESIITYAKGQIKIAQEQYIVANKKLTEGNVVEISHGKGNVDVGVLSSIEISYNGELKYNFKKLKKDGAPSTHGLYVWDIKEYKVVGKVS